MALAGALPDVFGRHDVAVIFRGHTRTVNAGAKSSRGNGVDPSIDIGLLLRQHASTLFLIEEDDGLRGKPFSARSGSGGVCVGLTDTRRMGQGIQFTIEASVEGKE